MEILTETIYDVKEDDEDYRDNIDRISIFTHPERPARHVFTASEDIGCNGERIAHTGQYNEATSQSSKGSRVS